jgi:hypothetical protein
MLLNENSFHEDVNQRKHFIFKEPGHVIQAAIRHGAYEHPDDYIPYTIEPEGLIKCLISKECMNI